MTYFVTRTKVSETNHPVPWVFGQVRRLADEFGKPGIVAKTGQKNSRIRRTGYLRLVWRSRRQAEQFQLAADEMYGDGTATRILRSRKQFHYQ